MKMTVQQATTQARRESSLSRQGSGWTLSTWSDEYQRFETSEEMAWSNARTARTDWIERRVAELLGPHRIEERELCEVCGERETSIQPCGACRDEAEALRGCYFDEDGMLVVAEDD